MNYNNTMLQIHDQRLKIASVFLGYIRSIKQVNKNKHSMNIKIKMYVKNTKY